MLTLSGIKNIIFDLGGVILNIDYQLTSNAFKEIGLKSFDDYYSQKTQTSIFNDLETGKINTAQFVSELISLNPQMTEENILKAWNAMLLDLPISRIEILRNLSEKYRLFLLSNTNEIHIRAFNEIIEKQYGSNVLVPCFEKVYFSNEMGLRKPDEECFTLVLKENGLKASETLFIDDSIQHIVGAESCGIKTHFVDTKVGQNINQLFPDIIQ
jgi:putative hydrolase of the HAD superfamily